MTFAPSIRITGAFTGINAVYADRFVRQDHDLVLVAATALERNGRPMLRIEKESDGHTTSLRLSGRIQSANIGNILAQMDDDSVRIVLDLGEVTLVDVEVIRFLSDCEDGGIVLVHCPPYVREWILRERAEGAPP